ncbi:glycosyltransferase, family 1 [Treponema primitia ZAS-2]|uniref:Glycosyltransferase, family 1 n=1 Tax=Treponema primitia (strain ATCC BAA-887 / DSM 12427 / ZAS-2) TaxID=545694 RepID=F5YHH8_TREPZ|nr:glycosyltransferase, family 1 [Treponema primitia ZAS-2]
MLIGNQKRLLQVTKGYSNVAILNCDAKPFSVTEYLFFPAKIRHEINKTTIYYSPFFNIPSGITIPIFTTIHDIVFADMPELVSKTGLAVRMWFFRRAAKHSRKIFTVSEFSKSRIEFYLGTKTPITVTYSGVQSFLFDADHRKTNKKDFILFIGNIKRHKGLWCLIDAFLKAKEAGLKHKLVIVGSKDNFRSADSQIIKIIDNVDSSIIEFTGFIDNEKLAQLLSEASLLVQPSLYEGFGSPPIEAIISGTKVLLSDIPVFKEIYSEFPVEYFCAGDSENLKDKLMFLLYNRQVEYLNLSPDLYDKYSFKKTAAIVLQEILK